MAASKINLTIRDGIATIELNDPPANTYSYEMMLEIDGAVLSARMDPGVHVVVIRGAGEKFFCAGANIGMLKTADPDFKYYFCLHANETLTRLEQTPKLVIAALNGHTVGGGLEVALAADIRIARKDGGRIGLPDYKAYSWYGVFGPTGLPAGIVERMAAAVDQALANPTIQARFEEMGTPVLRGYTPARFAEFVRSENATWAPLVKSLGITE